MRRHGDARSAADRAYRRAWWSLALYPLSSVAAFVIGEGLFSWLTDDAGDAALWQVFVSVTPAFVVFALPGLLAVRQARRAQALGRHDAMLPALLGVVITVGFVGLNLLSYLIGVVFG